jgi:hypothetical protein
VQLAMLAELEEQLEQLVELEQLGLAEETRESRIRRPLVSFGQNRKVELEPEDERSHSDESETRPQPPLVRDTTQEAIEAGRQCTSLDH